MLLTLPVQIVVEVPESAVADLATSAQLPAVAVLKDQDLEMTNFAAAEVHKQFECCCLDLDRLPANQAIPDWVECIPDFPDHKSVDLGEIARSHLVALWAHLRYQAAWSRQVFVLAATLQDLAEQVALVLTLPFAQCIAATALL